MATKPLAANSSPGLKRFVRYDYTKWIRLDRTSILQRPIPQDHTPRGKALRRFEIRENLRNSRQKRGFIGEVRQARSRKPQKGMFRYP